MEKEFPLQFQFIEQAENELREWSIDQNIKIHRIEFVVPFVLTDRTLAVWIFFETDRMMEKYKCDGTTEIIQSRFFDIMKDIGYPEDYVTQIVFCIDSHENVVSNFEGSYFNRLR